MRLLPAQPQRADLPPEERDAYDRVVARQRDYGLAQSGDLEDDRVQPYYGALLNSPLIANHISELAAIFRSRGETGASYSYADREFADLVTGRAMGYNLMFHAHLLDGAALGVRTGAMKAVWEQRDEDLNDDERSLAQYIRAVVTGTVSEESYSGMTTRYGVRGAVELTCFVAFLVMAVKLMVALGIPDISTETVEKLLQDVIDERVDLPDPTARMTPSIPIS